MPRKKKRSDKLPPSPWPEDLAPLPDLFIVDPRNRPLLEGTSRRGKLWREGLIKQIVALAVLLLFGLGFGAIMILPEVYFAVQIPQHGQTAQAQVENRYTSVINHRTNPITQYIVRYNFSIPDNTGTVNTYTFEQQVPQDVYDSALPGQIVTIRYLPSAPTQAILDGHNVHWTRAVSNTATTIVLFLFATFIVGVVSGAKKSLARELFDRGIWLCGYIEKIVRLSDRPGSGYKLTYSFTLPENRKFTRQIVQNDGSRKRQPFPPRGTPVAVRYVNEKLFEIM